MQHFKEESINGFKSLVLNNLTWLCDYLETTFGACSGNDAENVEFTTSPPASGSKSIVRVE